jgi:protoheme IX farnesyltransferase
VSALPLVLFAIIFLWTPPHFWALALYCRGDYVRAGVPMLPVTHGEAATRRHVLGYGIALSLVGVAPWLMGMAGPVYGVVAALIGTAFIVLAARVARSTQTDPARMNAERQLFRFSLLYLAVIFTAIAIDRGVLA